MHLSSILVNNLSNKLKFNTSLLQEEKNYITSLKKQIFSLSSLDDESKFPLTWKPKVKNMEGLILEQDFVLMYIITITFLKANTMIHVSDSTGKVKWFCSSGSINVTGKRKKQRRSVVLKLVALLFKKVNFLKKNPVALHLNNVSSYQTFIVDKLKKNIFIKIIKIFNQTPYNGCRKKKIRRKKHSKIFT